MPLFPSQKSRTWPRFIFTSALISGTRLWKKEKLRQGLTLVNISWLLSSLFKYRDYWYQIQETTRREAWQECGQEYLTETCLSPPISPSFLGAASYISPQKRDPHQSLHIATMSVGTYSFKIAIKLSSGNQSNVEWIFPISCPQHNGLSNRLLSLLLVLQILEAILLPIPGHLSRLIRPMLSSCTNTCKCPAVIVLTMTAWKWERICLIKRRSASRMYFVALGRLG